MAYLGYQQDRWRRLAAVTSVTLALTAVSPSLAETAGNLLVATVTWTASTGQTGSVLFQGRVVGSTLTGQLYAGNDVLAATGTMDASGGLLGTLATTDGTIVGTFSGTRDTPIAIEGAYATSAVSGGTFSAPADQMPGP